MFLSKLELFGFKSFANKTKLKFSEGIACVIGPNGSGKSNIVDSIRWVLGEQRVSSLRSDKMESVIFNGSAKRKSQSLAEVSLTIENNKNILDSPFSDVVISRRLYRNGESQYLINKTPCRLKDVLNLFMDTGMNATSYSVIELKMVETIVSENPEERRILFEEAAGVTKYKIRRKSAVRKLKSTKSDMDRISDMIGEITRSVNSLSRQVGKARRYLKFQEELKNKEIDLARFKYNQLQDDIRPLEQQLKEISVIKEDASHQITLEEALLENYKHEILQYEQKLSNINNEIYEYDKEIQNLKENDAVSRTRTESLLETKKRNVNDINEYEQKQKELNSRLLEYSENIDKIKFEVDETEEQFNSVFQEYKAESELHNSQKEKIEKLNSGYKNIFESLTEKKELFQSKSYLFNWNNDQKNVISQELKNLTHEHKLIGQKVNENSNRMEELESEDKKYAEKIDNLKNEIDKEDIDIENIKRELGSVNSSIETINSKIIFFEQVISNYEGHSESAKYLMKNKEKYSGVYGPLSEFITINDKYKNAVETALDSALNYIIVETTTIAKEIIKTCLNKNLGRITLLPLERLSILSSGKINDFPYPILSDLLNCPAKFKIIFNILLGDIAYVENLDEALSASKKYPKIRFVTGSGELVNFNREISGGQKPVEQASLIGRQQQLSNLKNELELLNSQRIDIEGKLSKKLENRNILIERLDSIRSDFEENKNQLNNIEHELAQNKYSEKNILDSMNQKNEKIETISNQIKLLEKEKNNYTSEIENLQKELNTIEKETINYTSKHENDLNSLQLLDKDVQNLKFKLINQQNIFENKTLDIARIKKSIEETNELSKKRKDEISNIIIEIESLAIEKEKRTERKNKIYEKRDLLETEKENLEVSYHELKNNILQFENQIKKYRKQHDSSLERTRQLELNIQENKIKSESIKDKLNEEYQVDISIGIPYEGLRVNETEQEIETLKYKIKQLGQVNPLAVTEYDKETERLDFYKTQYDDLNKATESLQQTIEKINKTARKQFKDTFNNIKNNFETVFQSFFANGEGTLTLQEGVDPLEADIDIFVRPKGKRLQTLNLLSGGEKTLTAISLLFAIYLVKPSPFCILDEIDAPLDDVNITRFTDALKDFAKRTQFIVITHNKRTMEAADTLYGVTMEEEGLSKLVSVKFN